jgi:acyl carrier protein
MTMEILGELAGILATRFDYKGVVTPETSFDDLELDSLDKIELVMMLEDETGVRIDDNDIRGMQTVGEIAEVVEQKLSEEVT